MTRSIFLALALAAVMPAGVALADEKPTADQLEQAKIAFADGKALHDQGKLGEAIEKFKESYKLSRNPVLLYNIAFTMDEAKQDLALFYYEKFLQDAPASDARRPAASERAKQLQQEKIDQSLNGGPSKPPDVTPPPDVKKPPVDAPPTKIKPIGTYKPDEFQHQVIEEAPPGKPLDITASVPQDSGWTVILYYRAAGEAAWTAKPMKWRYKELVARIPAKKMSGSAIQYYVECKEQNGEVIARAGKSPSPNLVNLDAAAAPRFYPDLSDDHEPGPGTNAGHGDDDDPLGNHHHEQTHHEDEPIVPRDQPGGGSDAVSTGFFAPNSKPLRYAAIGTAAGAVVLLAGGIIFHVEAGKQADALANDVSVDKDGHPCTAPCHAFDSFDQDLESTGKRDQTLSGVAFGLGAGVAVVSGYLWYRHLKGRHAAPAGEQAPATQPSSDLSWIIAPSAGDGFAGATALGRF